MCSKDECTLIVLKLLEPFSKCSYVLSLWTRRSFWDEGSTVHKSGAGSNSPITLDCVPCYEQFWWWTRWWLWNMIKKCTQATTLKLTSFVTPICWNSCSSPSFSNHLVRIVIAHATLHILSFCVILFFKVKRTKKSITIGTVITYTKYSLTVRRGDTRTLEKGVWLWFHEHDYFMVFVHHK